MRRRNRQTASPDVPPLALQLVQQLPDLAWLEDEQGRFLACNPAFAAFFAMASCDDGVVPAVLPVSLAAWPAGVARRIWAGNRAGQCVLLEITASVLRSDTGVCRLGSARDVSEQSLSEERFRALFDNRGAPAIQGYAPDGTVLYWNAASTALYGYSNAEALGRTLYELIIPAEICAHVREDVAQMFRQRRSIPSARLLLQHKNGHAVPVYSSHAMVDSPHSGLTLFCMDIDLSVLVRAESGWRDSETRYRTLFDASGDGIFVLRGQTVVDCNQAAAEIFCCAPAELCGRALASLSPVLQDGGVASRSLLAAYLLADESGSSRRFEWRHRRPDGSEFDAEWSLSSLDIAEVPHHLVSFRDITEKKKSAQLIWRQANFDSLTGLPNRNRFLERFAAELRQAARQQQPLALLFIDLDHFKEVNDTLGHRAGDLLLKEAALRLLDCVRDGDTVARLGGDEFTIVLSGMTVEAQLPLIQGILHSLAAPFRLGDELAYVSASIGITLYPADADNIEALQKHADQAMYAAKKLGRNRYCYFTPSMQEQAQARAGISNDLRRPEAAAQFQLLYQPVIALQTGRVAKAEALLRWQHPVRGLVNPAEFIPISEDTGLVSEIGHWVFREAASHAKYWRETCQPDLQVSVNVSPLQFYDDGLLPWLDFLDSLPLSGAGVALEITERLLLDVRDTVLTQLGRFHAAGVQILLDDFGTGYSSLSYLRQFHIDYLKIDRCFVTHLEQGGDDLALCEAIIMMAHRLGMKVIAEGVETEGQRATLAAIGCDYGQGFLFSAPLDAQQFEQFVRQRSPG